MSAFKVLVTCLIHFAICNVLQQGFLICLEVHCEVTRRCWLFLGHLWEIYRYSSHPQCWECSISVLSSGLNSF